MSSRTLSAIEVITLLLQASVVSSFLQTTTYPLTVVDKFTIPRTFENIATRHHGHLIVTSVTSSTLYQVSPVEEDETVAIANIARRTRLLGIVELEQDVFYVVAVNASSQRYSWFKIHLEVANITSAQLLNGMCRLEPNNNSMLLIADYAAGNVVKLDVETGAYEVIIDETSMKPLATGLQVAINGIHVH
ncbi:unnamed protein product [Penicillium discolor]